MIDTYSMILWANARIESIEKQTERVYQILKTLDSTKFLKPKYLTAKSKKEAKKFELTYDNVKNLINKNQDKKFPDLGSRIGFFTSMNDNEISSISVSTGVSNNRFKNTIVININPNHSVNDSSENIKLKQIFLDIVEIFEPFWGCICNKFNSQLYDTYYNSEKEIPNAVFWMNYWGKDIVEKINVQEKINQGKAENLYEVEKYKNGYFLRLQEYPINIDNKKELALQQHINQFFELDK